ncbi:L-lactate dehydrogenase [Streptococcus devriesei]|uniref:L-lactate dehydrogenase n=1 Tax=Streptococcus devriesei TaxID=231233 RepID=UPI0003FF6DC7|nr:L-lactate dehydrogenase [Streptococcus devriesei]
MTRKIGIIGMGHVGSTVAHGLIAQGIFDDYVLIDSNEAKVVADTLDFQDSLANSQYHANFIVNDYSALADADIIVSALGNIILQDNKDDNRFAELPFTSKEVIGVGQEIKKSGFKGILIVITNPVDVISQLYQKYTGLPREKVIGTGTLLDTARMKRALGDRLSVDPRSIEGYNLGEHGNSQFVAWSQVRVKGQAIQAFLNSEERNQVRYESMKGGHTVFRGKKYTSYGIATAAIRLVLAVLNDSHELMPVSHYFEAEDLYLGYPAVVGRSGIIEECQLQLNSSEEHSLAESAKIIRDNLDKALKNDFE